MPDLSGYFRKIGYRDWAFTHQRWTFLYDDELTEHQSVNLLEQDLIEIERTLNKSVKVTLAQHQFDALTSFGLDVGSYAFKKSMLPQYLGGHFFAQLHKISNILLTFH